jgi:hypothetical protein
MTNFIVFPSLKNGAMATPSAENFNGTGLGFCFEVAEFAPEDLNEGRIGYRYEATNDDLDIVHPDGSITLEKGKVVKLSKAALKKIVTQQKFAQKQKSALTQAKFAIKTAIINNVGSITDQLNAASTTDETIKQQWQAKFALRDAIKYQHGKRLKDAIRTATKVEELPEITDDFASWANGG